MVLGRRGEHGEGVVGVGHHGPRAPLLGGVGDAVRVVGAAGEGGAAVGRALRLEAAEGAPRLHGEDARELPVQPPQPQARAREGPRGEGAARHRLARRILRHHRRAPRARARERAVRVRHHGVLHRVALEAATVHRRRGAAAEALQAQACVRLRRGQPHHVREEVGVARVHRRGVVHHRRGGPPAVAAAEVAEGDRGPVRLRVLCAHGASAMFPGHEAFLHWAVGRPADQELAARLAQLAEGVHHVGQHANATPLSAHHGVAVCADRGCESCSKLAQSSTRARPGARGCSGGAEDRHVVIIDAVGHYRSVRPVEVEGYTDVVVCEGKVG
mmetsp:Transcript_17935/g.52322  ORF Transcript_17935/g.52322 Transcript_17935/m.52322 type:complete len:329 (-) Transcript_17935:6295-7281(-)